MNEKDGKFLQEVYIQMREIDGVNGIVGIENRAPTPETKVKTLELSGAYEVCGGFSYR